MMAEWVLGNLVDCNVPAAYFAIRYLFDLAFPLGSLPAMAIMGTATPRCKDTFFKCENFSRLNLGIYLANFYEITNFYKLSFFLS
jgi:hypothetical protein